MPGIQHTLIGPTGNRVQYVGSVSNTYPDGSFWNTSGEALDVLSIANEGDLVVIALTYDFSNTVWLWSGMNFIDLVEETGSATFGRYVGYRVVESGDANPYISDLGVGDWISLSVVASVFRNAPSYSGGTVTGGSSGMPNPPVSSGNYTLSVCTGHLDDDAVPVTRGDDWVLADSAAITTGASQGSTTMIGYKLTPGTDPDPAAFLGSGSDDWRATTLRFGG